MEHTARFLKNTSVAITDQSRCKPSKCTGGAGLASGVEQEHESKSPKLAPADRLTVTRGFDKFITASVKNWAAI